LGQVMRICVLCIAGVKRGEHAPTAKTLHAIKSSA
jgi:hypothetical protein